MGLLFACGVFPAGGDPGGVGKVISSCMGYLFLSNHASRVYYMTRETEDLCLFRTQCCISGSIICDSSRDLYVVKYSTSN